MAPKKAVYLAVNEAAEPNEVTEEWTITRRFSRHPQVLRSAAAGECELVIVDSLEALLARDLENGVALLAQLNALGVGVRSIQEPEITTEGPSGEGFAAFLEAVQKASKQRLKRNILAGQKRAERTGKTLGRPQKPVDAGEARRLSKAGKTVREIADALKISKSTVHRVLASKMR